MPWEYIAFPLRPKLKSGISALKIIIPKKKESREICYICHSNPISMKRLFASVIIFIITVPVAFSQAPQQPTPEQIQAYLRMLSSHPDQHVLTPDRKVARKSPYKGTKNYGIPLLDQFL